MSDRTHLCLEALEESCLPDEERIRRIRAERWISYARAEEVLVRMSELLEYPPHDRMPCLLLYGSTGMGKTKILRKFLRDHPSEPGRRKNSPRHPIISMQMPPEPDERSLYEEILSSLRVPVRSVSTSHLHPIVRDMLRYVGVRMLVVDEVHAMLSNLSLERFRSLTRYQDRPAAADIAFCVAAFANGMTEDRIGCALEDDYLSRDPSPSKRAAYIRRTMEKARRWAER